MNQGIKGATNEGLKDEGIKDEGIKDEGIKETENGCFKGAKNGDFRESGNEDFGEIEKMAFEQTQLDDSPSAAHVASACDRSDLQRWSLRGGPLPRRLSAHVRDCPGCAEQVRRVSRVFSSLTLLQANAAPVGLYGRANNRAMRMLRRTTRRSNAAVRLLRMKPDLTTWQRAQLHVARLSLAAAAVLLFMVGRAGVTAGLEQSRDLGQQLANVHWERHIDPDGEWLDPPHLA